MTNSELIKKAEDFLNSAAWCGGHGMPPFPDAEAIELIRELIDRLSVSPGG